MAKGKYEYWLTPEGLLRLEAWARDGLTDEQISQNIGIHRDTLNDWKKRYSDIRRVCNNSLPFKCIQPFAFLLFMQFGADFLQRKALFF